jgi:UPF0716 protein FxsA
MFRSLFLLFLIVPLIEIYLLIQVGSVIGAVWTVFAVVATAVIGVSLLRSQGLDTVQRAQLSLAQGQLPAVAMLEGVALIFSGALLLTPGFFTDSIGFLLLIPMLRQSLIKRMMSHARFTVHGQSMHSHHHYRDSSIIEGEIVEDDDKYIR